MRFHSLPNKENIMRGFKNIGMFIACIVIGLHISALPALCQIKMNISDIMRSPERYYNQQVKLSGKVVDVKASGNSMSGVFVLQDRKDVTAEIISDILPMVGKSYDITVVVYEGPESKVPLIREVSRKEKSKRYIGWLAGVAFALFAVMIVYQGSGDATAVQ